MVYILIQFPVSFGQTPWLLAAEAHGPLIISKPINYIKVKLAVVKEKFCLNAYSVLGCPLKIAVWNSTCWVLHLLMGEEQHKTIFRFV